jgi:hypothetical protein
VQADKTALLPQWFMRRAMPSHEHSCRFADHDRQALVGYASMADRTSVVPLQSDGVRYFKIRSSFWV